MGSLGAPGEGHWEDHPVPLGVGDLQLPVDLGSHPVERRPLTPQVMWRTWGEKMGSGVQRRQWRKALK